MRIYIRKNMRAFILLTTLLFLSVTGYAQMMDPAMMGGPMGLPGGRMGQGSQQQQDQPIICPECGTENEAGSEFCSDCGADLTMVAAGTGEDGEPVEVIPEIPPITIVEGELVIGKITQEVLMEPKKTTVPDEERENYYDDGTHGDAVEADGIYSKVEVNDNTFISPNANNYRRELVGMVNRAMAMDPLSFSGNFAAAITDVSELENITDLQIDQNRILENFRAKLLEPYKIDPQDIYSSYYPVFFPPKPDPPEDAFLEGLLNAAGSAGRGGFEEVMMSPNDAMGSGQIGLNRARAVAGNSAMANYASNPNANAALQENRRR